MKLAFIYGPWSVGARPIDFATLDSNPRGLTGSELSCIRIAQAMAARGHEVQLFCGDAVGLWHGLILRPVAEIESIGAGFDAAYAWNEPDLMARVQPGPLRMVDQQVNDFDYQSAGFDRFVDVYTSPSANHMAFMQATTRSTASKWRVLPNGCDPTLYSEGHRVPGRVIWASSADRGLHLVLQCWPEIKRRVPHASLRCFYNFAYGQLETFENGHERGILEIAQRVRYIRNAMERLKHLDVVHVGSVSRDAMTQAWNEAEVLAYPTETIRYSEGFSVTSMEACAAGVVPVLAATDALGEIYGGVAPMVPFPPSAHLPEFTDLVVRGLTDEAWRREVTERAKEFAQGYSWERIAGQLELLIADAKRAKAGAAIGLSSVGAAV
jgi:glycosyltransferase involved in cell wall biosynthesis